VRKQQKESSSPAASDELCFLSVFARHLGATSPKSPAKPLYRFL
jgi:hypothetical protein